MDVDIPKRGRGRPKKYIDPDVAKQVCAKQKKEHYYNLKNKSTKYDKLVEYLKRNDLVRLLPEDLF